MLSMEMYRILRNFRATPTQQECHHRPHCLVEQEKPSYRSLTKANNATLAGNNQKGKAKMRRFAHDSKRKRGAPQEHEPHKVIRKKGPMVTARNERGTVTRQSSYFKQEEENI